MTGACSFVLLHLPPVKTDSLRLGPANLSSSTTPIPSPAGVSMSWLQRYRLRFYLRNSIWIWPAVGIVAALIFVPLLTAFEQAMEWHMSISADTARIVLGTVAASTFTLV